MEHPDQLAEAALVLAAPLGRLVRGQRGYPNVTGLPVDERDGEAGDIGKALLPDRILEDNRDDLEPALERVQPFVAARQREEVRDDEEERAAGQVAALLGEVCEPAGERVLGRP